MPLILVIEPDGRQASQITAIVRGRLRAQLVLADSAQRALVSLGDRIPDVILTPALLAPRDEAAVSEWLLGHGDAAAHVQTLTIPFLGTTAPTKTRKDRLLSVFKRGRTTAGAAPDACAPEVFADQITSYIERAAAARQARETTPSMRPAIEMPHQAEDPLTVDSGGSAAFADLALTTTEAEGDAAAVEPAATVRFEAWQESPEILIPAEYVDTRPEEPAQDVVAFDLSEEPVAGQTTPATDGAEEHVLAFVVEQHDVVASEPSAPASAPVGDLPLSGVDAHPGGEAPEREAAESADHDVAVSANPLEWPAGDEVSPVSAPTNLPGPPVETVTSATNLTDETATRCVDMPSSPSDAETLQPHSDESAVWQAIERHASSPRGTNESVVVPEREAPVLPQVRKRVDTAKSKARGRRNRPQDDWRYFDPGEVRFAALLAKLDEITSNGPSRPGANIRVAHPEPSEATGALPRSAPVDA